MITIPITPPPGLLESMAMRFRHDFGLDRREDAGPLECGMTDAERASLLGTMRQLHEEVVGTGFFKYPS